MELFTVMPFKRIIPKAELRDKNEPKAYNDTITPIQPRGDRHHDNGNLFGRLKLHPQNKENKKQRKD